jgi:hypothetical protein
MNYTHLRVSLEAGKAIRTLSAVGTGMAMRQITQSDALIAAVKVARNYPDEFADALSPAEDAT